MKMKVLMLMLSCLCLGAMAAVSVNEKQKTASIGELPRGQPVIAEVHVDATMPLTLYGGDIYAESNVILNRKIRDVDTKPQAMEIFGYKSAKKNQYIKSALSTSSGGLSRLCSRNLCQIYKKKKEV